jgi:hypothetical protein
MQRQIQEFICVDGNRYFTQYGFYTCKVTASTSSNNLIEIEVTLIRESGASEIARIFRIIGTLPAIGKQRVSLVIDIHKWALLDRDADTYWIKKVLI